MGCNQSKIENEEAVSRCKDRRHFMKEAVSNRNAFAAAHSSYAMSLKNTGAALNDYAQGEIHPLSSSAATAAPPPPPPSSVLPPPPPNNMDFQTLQRSTSMPEMKIQKPEMNKPVETIHEEEEMEYEAHDNERLVRKRSSTGSNRGSTGGNRGSSVQENHHQQQQSQDYWDDFFPPMDSFPGPSLAGPPEMEEEVRINKEQVQRKVYEEKVDPPPMVVEEKMEKAMEVSVPVPVPEMSVGRKMGGGEGGRRVVKGMNFMQIFVDLDDHFLKASESAHEVSKLLEATRLHYHSNFADNRGHIDHSARVMRVITWNRSFRGVPDLDGGKDDFDIEEHETHATVLDKMLAWEKKLFDEVKAGELMKYEYQRKVNSLNKQKKRGTNTESLEKLKAAVSHLHTRYIVDMQSMDSTVSEINQLRDEQLYPKLVDGMATMWDTMRYHHEAQSKIVNALRALDISQSPKETSEHHHDRTFQLLVVVQGWQSQFCKLIDNQKGYIRALNSWLKLNLIPIESSLKEKVSSPPRVQNPPIQSLLIAWHDFLDKLPDEVARTAINNFASVIHTIMQHQEEEMKLKEKCEETRKELFQKTRKFEDWYHKYMQQKMPAEFDPELTEDKSDNDAIADRQFAVDAVKKRLEEEEEAYKKQRLQVREKSLASLRIRLPELFRAMLDTAQACSEMYRNLRYISQGRNAG